MLHTFTHSMHMCHSSSSILVHVQVKFHTKTHIHAHALQNYFYFQNPQQFQDEYRRLALQGRYNPTDGGGRMYDAVWILATALNRTMAMVKSGNINGTGCENTSGSLVPLEQFQYSNEKMGCLIQYNIQITNFSGVSVS